MAYNYKVLVGGQFIFMAGTSASAPAFAGCLL
jgi:hypothetical protein